MDLDAELLAQMRGDFLAEAQDILVRLGGLLADLERSANAETINAVFREAHTLKGTAGFLGLTTMETVAHRLEDLFSRLRRGTLAATPAVLDVAFEGVQVLTAMRSDLQAGGAGDADAGPLLERISALLAPPTPTPAPADPAPVAPVPVALADPAPADPAPAEAPHSEESVELTLRVDVRALNTLMTLVGELITARNALLAHVERLGDQPLDETAAAIGRLTGQLQDTVTTTRLVPVNRLFARFTGVIRALAREQGKGVRLISQGGDTPLDRAISEGLYDPLIHLLRNAIDHGLETPAQRLAAGKPAEGVVRLDAQRRGDTVELTVADDGRGMDPARLRAVAVERGLITPPQAAALSDEAALRLIFTPGFSTAPTVTDISGRGVGMDVVLRNVRRLRGTIDVRAIPGQGATFIVRVPLILSLQQVLLVRAAGHTYALPLRAVRETLRFQPEEAPRVQHGEVIFLRDAALPVCSLAHWLGYDIPPRPTSLAQSAVVARLANGPRLLIVDALEGTRQVVVKPLSPYLGAVRGVDGAAILPDGTVTLILDLEELAQQ